MQDNPRNAASLTPWLIGAGLLGAWWLLSGTSSAGAGFAPTSCPVDINKLNDWLIEKQLAGNCAPKLSLPVPYSSLVVFKIAPPDPPFGIPFVLVTNDGKFWYYKDKNAEPAESASLRDQFAKYASVGVSGHPADFFMVGA